MQDYRGIFFDSIVAALEIHVGEDDGILVSDMKYVDATLANLWPVVQDSSGVPLPRLDWVKAYKRRLHSGRYGRFVLHDMDTDQNLAAVRMGATRRGDRIAITHLSRHMGDGRLSGKMAQVGITSLLLSQERVLREFGVKPEVAILNPFDGALPHYIATASEMSLQTRLHVAGRASLLYIEDKQPE